jgi:hypothetical protein
MAMIEATEMFDGARAGDERASARPFVRVHTNSRLGAAQTMACEAVGHPLPPTALGYESWLWLGADAQPNRRNRVPVFSPAVHSHLRSG